MIGENIQTALNEQITHEFYASQYYLSMSAYFERQGYPGFAVWMRAQAEEERAHAMRIFDFVNDREGHVVLGQIAGPPVEFGTPLEVFEALLKHEREVTSLVNALYKLSLDEADYPTQVMLQWFINEQVEEEKVASEIIDRLRLAGDDTSALLLLETELGQRAAGAGDAQSASA